MPSFSGPATNESRGSEKLRTTAPVPSVEASSTTISSKSARVWARTLRIASPRNVAPLLVGMQTLDLRTGPGTRRRGSRDRRRSRGLERPSRRLEAASPPAPVGLELRPLAPLVPGVEEDQVFLRIESPAGLDDAGEPPLVRLRGRSPHHDGVRSPPGRVVPVRRDAREPRPGGLGLAGAVVPQRSRSRRRAFPSRVTSAGAPRFSQSGWNSTVASKPTARGSARSSPRLSTPQSNGSGTPSVFASSRQIAAVRAGSGRSDVR